MRLNGTTRFGALALACALANVSVAQPMGEGEQPDKNMDRGSSKMEAGYGDTGKDPGKGMDGGMRSSLLIRHANGSVQLGKRAVSGDELLEAELYDGTRPVGGIEDVVLGGDDEITYVKFETTQLRDLDEEGWIEVTDMDLEPAAGFEVHAEFERPEQRGERRIMLEGNESQSRVLTAILRSHMMVEGDAYAVRDIVFDRTGKARYFIVGETEGGFLQPGDAFTVPFDHVQYRDGAWRTGLDEGELGILIAYVE